jgi:dolichol-phosphate mannosyltransferase
MPKKTLVFIPTYNERSNVGPMCERVLALGLDADLVFLDDSSPDGTGELLDALAAKHPRVAVIHRPGKAGIGGAHLDGISHAYDNGYELLVTLDCDFTHSPELIPAFLEAAEGADLVVGSRFLDEGSLPGWTLPRRFLTILGHALTKGALGIPHDATGAFRVYNLQRLPRRLFELVVSRGYAFFFESMLLLAKNGFRIVEIPVELPARTYGNSKMSYLEVARSVRTLASLFIADRVTPSRFRLSRRPELDPTVEDVQNWNEYWDHKNRSTNVAYDAIATFYRNAIIRHRLEETIRQEFRAGAKLLHAGCGSGQVDVGLHSHASITAVDVSRSALEIYSRANPHAHQVRQASIFDLPFEDATFDGAYNLGVVEHFTSAELPRALAEIRRVIKPGGKLVAFWPHAHASSVMVLKTAHWFLNDILSRDVRLHPPEYSLLHSRKEAQDFLTAGGLELDSYHFGPGDLFVQAVVVGRRPPS